MVGQKGFALARTETEEHDVDFVEGEFGGEIEVRFAKQPGMDIGERTACMALTVDKDELCFGMVEQQAAEFTSGIVGTANNSYSDHGRGDMGG